MAVCISAGLLAIGESGSEGRGVFACKDILAGAVVSPLTGRRLHRRDIDWKTYEGLIMQIDDDWFMEESGGVDDYFNHSCEPNIAFTADGSGFYALRAIGKGEELCFDYSTCEDDREWKIPCRCGAASCRGHITGFSALDAATQERLRPYCRPYLRKRRS